MALPTRPSTQPTLLFSPHEPPSLLPVSPSLILVSHGPLWPPCPLPALGLLPVSFDPSGHFLLVGFVTGQLKIVEGESLADVMTSENSEHMVTMIRVRSQSRMPLRWPWPDQEGPARGAPDGEGVHWLTCCCCRHRVRE